MKKMFESARSVDVVLETDVLVVGSGPGGLAAAMAAARAGARTAYYENIEP
jgi:NADPH-dependent 2,4-dienoyl-CoA reductase/sulfur reductase-like enzyme